ncbi:MAG: autotransporter-associated beta strand repeat-containing protein, partial [Verrucomicrobiae bacterium]|nr:autotransporter-associated beta strand repeat-containing protein [Verrucomicrobiae bacterium]
GTNYYLHNGLRLQSAPTTVRAYSTGTASLYGWDTNATQLTVSDTASGSVIDSSVRFVSGTYGYVMNVATGLNTATGDVTLQGVLTGSTTYRKNGAGSVAITGAATHSGTFDLRAGRVILSGGDNRLGANSSLVLGNGSGSGKLILDGISQTFANLSTAGSGTSNAVVGGSATASTLVVNYSGAGNSFSGTIGGTSAFENNIAFTKSGTGTYTLSGFNTYTGATTINSGVLRLDYSTSDSSKLSDSTTLVFAGGSLDLAGGTHAETVAGTTLTGTGEVTITRSSGSATIALGDITRTSTGTIDIAAAGIATTTTANDVLGQLPPWITVNGQPAANDGSGNVIVYVPSYTDVNRLGGQITSDPSSFIRIVNGGTSGDITPASTGLTEIAA